MSKITEAEAKRLMAENKIDNYAVDPGTEEVQIKRPSAGPSDTNWPDANPKSK
jgi:hypothetical protein